MAEARSRDGDLDVAALLRTISSHYDRIDAERRGIVRSMQLMSDEAQALTREIREQTASHLQAILDNVKDAIVTVDDGGHIETFNPTGERIFGYAPAEIFGRSLEFLLPEIAKGTSDFLERLATKIDDTHVDLAAHQIRNAGLREAEDLCGAALGQALADDMILESHHERGPQLHVFGLCGGILDRIPYALEAFAIHWFRLDQCRHRSIIQILV